MDSYIFNTAMALVLAAVISGIAALTAMLTRRFYLERMCGIICIIAAAVSGIGYYYLRFIQSGGTFSDWRVALVLALYTAAIIIGALFALHGNKKLKQED